MNQILQNQPLTLFGDGSQTRAFTHVDDVAPHIARSVHVPDAYNHVINIGADRACTVNRLAAVVANAFEVQPEIRYLPARSEVRHAYADHAKARNLLGARPTVDLETGVARMAKWARRIGSRRGKPFGRIEILEKLPPSWTAMVDSEAVDAIDRTSSLTRNKVVGAD